MSTPVEAGGGDGRGVLVIGLGAIAAFITYRLMGKGDFAAYISFLVGLVVCVIAVALIKPISIIFVSVFFLWIVYSLFKKYHA